MRYVGQPHDLEKRLQGMTLAEWSADPKCECIFHVGEMGDEFGDGDAEYDEGEEEGEMDQEEMIQTLTQVQGSFVNLVGRWCENAGQTPHPRLPEAVTMMMAAMAPGLPGMPKDEPIAGAPATKAEIFRKFADEALASREIPEVAELKVAVDQVHGFILEMNTDPEFTDKLFPNKSEMRGLIEAP